MLASTLLLFAAAVRAIQITSPANGTVWKTGEPVTISWSAVNTDPDSFTLAVQVQEPFSTQEIGVVNTADGSFTWTPPASLAGEDYRINFLDSKGSGILAQSGYFDVEAGSAVASSSGVVASGALPSASVSGLASQAPIASRSVSGAVPSNSALVSGAVASGSGALPPNVSGTAAAASAAGTLVPSLALVAGSLIALFA